MNLTVKQYLASLMRCDPPEDMRHQINAWPYPQASQSHIAFWRARAEPEGAIIPRNFVCVYLDNSDCPGALMRVRSGQPSPEQLAKMLNEE